MCSPISEGFGAGFRQDYQDEIQKHKDAESKDATEGPGFEKD